MESALEKLIRVMVPEESDVEGNEDPENNVDPEINLPDNSNELDAIYKQSMYFQDFSAVTFKPTFQMHTQNNEIYSVEFGNVFLKKYVSIFCLWTCIILEMRRSSGPAESHFRCTKSRVKQRQTKIGTVPLKCGRFCRELELYTKSTTRSNLLKIPRKKNCYKQKRKRQSENEEHQPPSKQLKVIDANKPIMALYKAAPKPKTPTSSSCRTPKSRATPSSQNRFMSTPSGTRTSKQPQRLRMDSVDEYDLEIDNESATETWYRQRKVAYSHTIKNTMRSLRETDFTGLRNILVKQKATRKIDEVRTRKMKNYLFDDPEWYIKPSMNYVVARIGRKSLHKDNYIVLFENAVLPRNFFDILVSLIQHENKTFQIDSAVDLATNPKKITKKKLCVLFADNVIVADTTTLSFSCFNAKIRSAKISSEMFLDYLKQHNKKFQKNTINEIGWTLKEVNYPLLQPSDDPALWVIYCTKMYIEKQKMTDFQPETFKRELQHWILWKSTTMKDRCVICGLFNDAINSNDVIPWVNCLNCDRWTHLDCISKTLDEVEKSTYLCIVCAANMVQMNQPTEVNDDNTYMVHSGIEGYNSTDTDEDAIIDIV